MTLMRYVLLTLLLVLYGCQSDDNAASVDVEAETSPAPTPMNEGPWPPRAPQSAPSGFNPQPLKYPRRALVTDTGYKVYLPDAWIFESDGWKEVYLDSTNRRDRFNQFHYALTFNSLDFELDGNLFEFPVHTDRYLVSEFEVVYYNEDKTGIRLVPETEDRYGFLRIDDTSGEKTESYLPLSAIIPGATLRVGQQIFELRQDGWYLEDTKISDVVPFSRPQ